MYGFLPYGHFSLPELRQLLRVNKFYFPDAEQHTKLLLSLTRSETKVNEILKDENDHRGNTNFQHSVQLESNIGDAFTLDMPIYKGMASFRFRVEILIEKRDKAVSVWLESPEAIQIMEEEWIVEVKRQRAIFDSKKITVIEN